ncbi:type I restriction-modification enzyme S subunit [Calothrix sp. NIES-4071]|nr:type I restriction-modification enzyme S subunit [Calothrix sp. NIES-4071]BAZ61614.1 type I restriction-modification enzyme S subunit [Calothrix sp. NIES-4105]
MVPNIPSKIAFGITHSQINTKFKQTEVGKIPQEWEVVKTGDVCTSIVPGRNKPKIFDGDIPWITIPDVDGLTLSASKTGLAVSREELKKAKGKTIPPNTVVMTCVGTFGIAAIATREIVINQQLHGFICKEDVLPLYLCWVLRAKEADMIALAGKTTIPYLNREKCESIYFALPPLPEQKKIAAILNSVDEAIAKTQAVIEQTRKVKQGLLQQLLTRGIGHTKFKDSAIGKIPECWDVKTLSSVVASDKPITYGIVQAGPHIPDGIPYIRVSDMAGTSLSSEGMLRTSPEIAERYKRSAVAYGDIVYALRGNIGCVLLVPQSLHGANLTQGTARISPGNNINPIYLLWSLRSPLAVKQALLESKGSTFKEISLEKLRQIKITIPPIEEQSAIAKMMEEVEYSYINNLKSLKSLQQLKRTLMQDLLTGCVRVTT